MLPSNDATFIEIGSLVPKLYDGCDRRHHLIDLSRSQRSPKVTIFQTVDEIAYGASTGATFIEIGVVDPEL